MRKSMAKSLTSPGKLKTRLLLILIASVVVACYLPILNSGYVWDDNVIIVENSNYRGLSFSYLSWMFTTYHDSHYHPLAWLTLGIDFVLWGMNPAGYHLTNIVVHVVNTVLFYFLMIVFLQRITTATNVGLVGMQIGAACGALFFAVHPLRVENVAWISTRGDLLCGGFYILTIIAYVRMNEGKNAGVRRKWFLLALLFFMFSLLSKAWGITMPVVLLVLDVYPLRRFDFMNKSIPSCKKLLSEKIPFILLALAFGLVAFWVKRWSMPTVVEHGIIDRLMQATYGLCFYISKTVLPIRLSPFYLLGKTFNPLDPQYILSAISVVAITLGLTRCRHRYPWALAAWACYAVTVFPVLGFAQSGPQVAADRYTYIACMPFAILAGAGVHRLWVNQEGTGLFAAMAVVWAGLLVFAVNSSMLTRIWYDNSTLLDHILKLDPGNYIAYYDRGLMHDKQGDLAAALADYTNVIRLDPEHAKAYNNRGILCNSQGDSAGAMEDFNTAIRLAPFSPEAYANRGMIRLAKNDLQRAFDDFTKVLEVASAAWPHRAVIEQLHISIRKRLEATD